MLTIAIWGAAGNMGTRACNRLREDPEYRILCVEVIPAGLSTMSQPLTESPLRCRAIAPPPRSRLVVEVAGDLGPREQLIDARGGLEGGIH
jgi:hypothetical protein